MFQLLGQEHWEFTRNICDTYGAVAKLHGPLGVCDGIEVRPVLCTDLPPSGRIHPRIRSEGSAQYIRQGPGVLLQGPRSSSVRCLSVHQYKISLLIVTHSAMELLIGPGLLATYGAPHKKQRKMLNPVFSVAHMRNLTPLFYSITDKVRFAQPDVNRSSCSREHTSFVSLLKRGSRMVRRLWTSWHGWVAPRSSS